MGQDGLKRANPAETAAVMMLAGGPLFAKGVIVRRPAVVALLEACRGERGGVKLLQAMRRKYGPGPLLLPLGIRTEAVLLEPDHVRRVLAETPRPFRADSNEKRAALGHFEPQGLLISTPEQRVERRRFNAAVLETPCPIHRLHKPFEAAIAAEFAPVIAEAPPKGRLSWRAFKPAWARLSRRVVFGAGGRNDEALTDTLLRLRRDANWAFLHPGRTGARERFLAGVQAHLDRAEPDSLAALMAQEQRPGSAPADQVGQWLFAFDAAGIGTFRALALLAAHPQVMARAREETGALPLLRATLLESVRLWPTTPAILRQAESETIWDGGTLPAGTGFLIHVPFLHRDTERLPYANRFVPEVWLDAIGSTGRAEAHHGFVPFSAGPAGCPARNLVLLLSSLLLSRLIRTVEYELPAGRLVPSHLPMTFNHFGLSLRVKASPPC